MVSVCVCTTGGRCTQQLLCGGGTESGRPFLCEVVVATYLTENGQCQCVYVPLGACALKSVFRVDGSCSVLVTSLNS